MPASNPTATLPKNWPSDVAFLRKPQISAPLSPTALQIQDPNIDDNNGTKHPATTHIRIHTPPAVPSPLVAIKPITTPTSHPARGQRGLFACTALAPGSFILFYQGAVHDSSSTDPHSDYDLSLDRDRDLAVDATRAGNEARFINDYRGVRVHGPNAEFRDCVVGVGSGVWERRIGVFVLSAGHAAAAGGSASGKGKGKKGGKSGKDGKGGGKAAAAAAAARARGIAKGEEIVVSYGKGFWDARRSVEVVEGTPVEVEMELDEATEHRANG